MIDEAQQDKIKHINYLLLNEKYDRLEEIILSENVDILFGDDVLDAVMALRLYPTLMLISNLAVENSLGNTENHAKWLSIYECITSQKISDEINHLNENDPLKITINAIIKKNFEPEFPSKSIYFHPTTWVEAIRLAIDTENFKIFKIILDFLTINNWNITNWLNLSKLIVTRIKFSSFDGKYDNGLLERSFGLLAYHTPISENTIILKESLLYHAGYHAYLLKEYARAEAYFNQITSHERQFSIKFVLGSLSCLQNKFSSAIKYLDDIVEDLTGSEIYDSYVFEGIDPEKGAEAVRFDEKGAAKALKDLQNIMNEYGKSIFLVAGTLLGYVREKEFLAHDKDMDVGIFAWEDQYDIVIACLESKLFIVKTFGLQQNKTYHFRVIHLETNLPIDIFVHHRTNGKLITGIHNSFGYLQKYMYSDFDLKEIDFLGSKFHIPNNPEIYLTEAYGEWEKPDPYFLAQVESDAMMDQGGYEHQIACRVQIINWTGRRSPNKIERSLNAAKKIKNQPGGMSDDAISKVEMMIAKMKNELNNNH